MSRPLYTLLLFLLLPLIPLRLLWRSVRQPEYRQHVGERFGRFDERITQPVIWVHCVSVGETRAAEPLVKLLMQDYPGHRILLTHATPTGRATGEQLFGDRVSRAYLPYDLPFAVQAFLRHYRPVFGVLMETELWFNLIHACKVGGIPLYLANARLSEKSAKGYARLGQLPEAGLCELAAIAAQTRSDAERLCELGAPEVEVTGNLKFDVSVPEDAAERGAAMRALAGGDRPVLLAASTRDGEEALVLDAIEKAAVPGLVTIIVPRHPQRFDEVTELLASRGLRFRRRSESRPLEPEARVLLGDSMGEMVAYYGACDFALIGGSLLPYGGQNLIEACALGKPVLIGPHTYNFEEVAEAAVMQGAAIRVWDVPTLAVEIARLAAEPVARRDLGQAGLEFIAASQGAAKRTLAMIRRHAEKLAARPGAAGTTSLFQ